MCNSLVELNNQLIKHNLHLQLFYGNYKKILISIFDFLYNYNDVTIAFNNDFSNYAIDRDNYIINLCSKYKYTPTSAKDQANYKIILSSQWG